MYRKGTIEVGRIRRTEIQEGETIENKIARITNNGEPITDGSPVIFTERKDGVMPEFNPRTDKWDIAIDAMDAVSRSQIAKRGKVIKMEPKTEDAKGESTQGTSDTTE